MTPEERAIRLVSGWIDDYRIYLKDGGGSAGVHAAAKEGLINAVTQAFKDITLAQPPAGPVRDAVSPGTTAPKKKEPSKPRTLSRKEANAV